jgi:hypothetical protein
LPSQRLGARTKCRGGSTLAPCGKRASLVAKCRLSLPFGAWGREGMRQRRRLSSSPRDEDEECHICLVPYFFFSLPIVTARILSSLLYPWPFGARSAAPSRRKGGTPVIADIHVPASFFFVGFCWWRLQRMPTPPNPYLQVRNFGCPSKVFPSPPLPLGCPSVRSLGA